MSLAGVARRLLLPTMLAPALAVGATTAQNADLRVVAVIANAAAKQTGVPVAEAEKDPLVKALRERLPRARLQVLSGEQATREAIEKALRESHPGGRLLFYFSGLTVSQQAGAALLVGSTAPSQEALFDGSRLVTRSDLFAWLQASGAARVALLVDGGEEVARFCEGPQPDLVPNPEGADRGWFALCSASPGELPAIEPDGRGWLSIAAGRMLGSERTAFGWLLAIVREMWQTAGGRQSPVLHLEGRDFALQPPSAKAIVGRMKTREGSPP